MIFYVNFAIFTEIRILVGRQSILGNPRKGLMQKEIIVVMLGKGSVRGREVTQSRTTEIKTSEMEDAASLMGT